MTNILEKIIEEKKHSLDLIKKEKSLDILEKNIKEQSFLNFKETIQKNRSVSLITEIKKASPSAGVLVNNFDHLEIEELKPLAKKFKISVPSLLTHPREIWGIQTPPVVPATFFINPNGELVLSLFRPQTKDKLNEIIIDLKKAF